MCRSRQTLAAESMKSEPTHAEEYTRKERIRIGASIALPGVGLLVASQLWLFPAIKEFASTAHCRTVWGISGTSILFYGSFVGLPLFVAVITSVTLGWRGVKVLRHHQVPPPGEKVFRPTPIRRGKAAQLIGLLHLFAATPFLCIGFWGYLQARDILNEFSNTAANPSVERTHNGGARLRVPPLSAAPSCAAHVKR